MSQLVSENVESSHWPLLNKRSLEACLPELKHTLAYVYHLRAYWRPERKTKLIVPSSWMEFFASTNKKCGMECTRDRGCPFRNVRFESNAETRFGSSDERLTWDVASQLFIDLGKGDDLNVVPSFVTRAFEGIPHCKLRSDWTAISESVSQNTTGIRPLDFALVRSQDGYDAEDTPRNGKIPKCLLLGIQGSTQSQQSVPSKTLALTHILEDLAIHGHFHLSLLATLIKRGSTLATTESFPEWLVLFGLVYDAEHLRIVVHLPHPSLKEGCVSYIVDELTLRSSVTPTAGCELILERLRILLALSTLRRHLFQLSRSLFDTVGSCDGIGRNDDNQSHFDHSQPERCNSPCSSKDCSSIYSTCPSSTHANNLECAVERSSRYESSSCRSSISSFCSTCSSLSETPSASDSVCSERSKCTESEGSNYMYMEPSTMSGSQGGVRVTSSLKELMEKRRREIIAWARGVVPSEHPVKDTYQMIIRHDAHPRRRRHVELKLNTHR